MGANLEEHNLQEGVIPQQILAYNNKLKGQEQIQQEQGGCQGIKVQSKYSHRDINSSNQLLPNNYKNSFSLVKPFLITTALVVLILTIKAVIT